SARAARACVRSAAARANRWNACSAPGCSCRPGCACARAGRTTRPRCAASATATEMRIAGEPAFVLHARPWRESSLLVEALTAAHGRLGLVARGVRSARRQPLRAALQPLQYVRLDAVQQGELAQLRQAEALDAAPALTGEATLAAFYVNELVLRLAPRNDPQPELFDAYATMRARLGDDALPLAWTLR